MTAKMKSFVKGILVGLAGKPLEFAPGEPVAYLYNGVRLPQLPEWDKEVYPFAVIVAMNDTEYPYALYCAKQEFVIKDGKPNFATLDIHQPLKYEYYSGGTEWVGGESTLVQTGLGVNGTAVWSNHNLLNKADGAINLAASEPVPVYE